VEDVYQFDDGRVGMDVLARYYKVRPAARGGGRVAAAWLQLVFVGCS
jgi:hypothetical protein